MFMKVVRLMGKEKERKKNLSMKRKSSLDWKLGSTKFQFIDILFTTFSPSSSSSFLRNFLYYLQFYFRSSIFAFCVISTWHAAWSAKLDFKFEEEKKKKKVCLRNSCRFFTWFAFVCRVFLGVRKEWVNMSKRRKRGERKKTRRKTEWMRKGETKREEKERDRVPSDQWAEERRTVLFFVPVLVFVFVFESVLHWLELSVCVCVCVYVSEWVYVVPQLAHGCKLNQMKQMWWERMRKRKSISLFPRVQTSRFLRYTRVLTSKLPKRTNPVDRETRANEMRFFLPHEGFCSIGLVKDRGSQRWSPLLEGSMVTTMSPGVGPSSDSKWCALWSLVNSSLWLPLLWLL